MGKVLRAFLIVLLTVFICGSLSSLPLKAQDFVVNHDTRLTARTGPGTTFSKRGLLPGGTRLKELERDGNWSKVETPGGETVWVHNSYILRVDSNIKPNAEIAKEPKVRIIAQAGHTSPIWSISGSRDGRFLITSGEESELTSSPGLMWGSTSYTSKLWNVETGDLISSLSGNEKTRGLEISPDGRFAAIFEGRGRRVNSHKRYDIYSLHDGSSRTADGEPLSNFFSSDNKTVATVVDDTELVIRDVEDLKPVSRWELHTPLVSFDGFSLSNDHRRFVAWSDIIAAPRVLSFSRPNQYVELEGPFDLIRADDFRFSPSGKYVFSVDRFSRRFAIWNANSGERVTTTIALENQPTYSLQWSGDDTKAAINFEDHSIIWDMTNSRKLSQPEESQLTDVERSVGNGITGFSSDGSMFFTIGNAAVWNTETGRLIHQFHKVGWAGQLGSHILHFARGGGISKYNRRDFKKTGELGKKVIPVKFAAWNQEGWLASTTVEEIVRGISIEDRLKRLSFWDTASASFVSRIDRKGILERFEIPAHDNDARNAYRWASPGGEVMVSLKTPPRELFGKKYFSSAIRRIQKGELSGDSVSLQDGPAGNIIRLIESSRILLSPDLIRDFNGTGVDHSVLKFWDVDTGQLIHTIDIGDRFKFDLINLTVSRNGGFVAAEMNYARKKHLRVWNTSTFEEVSDTATQPGVNALLAISPDGKTGLVRNTDEQALQLIDMANGQTVHQLEDATTDLSPLRCSFCEDYQLADFTENGRFVVTAADSGSPKIWNVASGKLVRTLRGHTAAAHSVDWSRDDQQIVTGSDDGSTRIWRVIDGKELVRLYSFPDNEWIAVTPEGFFQGSPNAANYLLAVNGVQSLPIDRFFDALYRPDLVLEAIRGDPGNKVREAARQLDLAKIWDSGQPPRVAGLQSPQGSEVNVDRVDVVADLILLDGGIGRVEIRINGATQIVDDIPADSSDRIKISQSVFLTPGKNQIEVVAYNQAGLISSKPVMITVESTAVPKNKPTLHVLAIGVNAYEDNRIPTLNYAVNDAVSIGQAFLKTGEGIFDSVQLTTVRDGEATADNLDRIFTKIGTQARPEDVFVFYLSGHGRTQDGRYYFIPPDFALEGLRPLEDNAINQQKWQSWMARIPAQKSVLLYDTCESGSAAREKDNGGLEVAGAIDRLTRATGRTILTAATDTEPSLEGYGGHGVFTYLVLEALGAADKDNDGQLEVTELASYIETELPAVSFEAFQHRQVPQASISGYSFSLGRPALVLGQDGR